MRRVRCRIAPNCAELRNDCAAAHATTDSWKRPWRWELVSMPKPIERPPSVMLSISMCVCSVSPSGISSSVISPIVTPGSAVIRRLSTSIERIRLRWPVWMRYESPLFEPSFVDMLR